MKKLNKIVSLLLAVLMLLGSFGISAFAAEENSAPEYTYKTVNQMMDYLTGKIMQYDENGKLIATDQGEPIYKLINPDEPNKYVLVDTVKEKLELMDLRLEKDGHRLYIDEYSGEIALENIASGEIMFSNPYDVGAASWADTIKAQLLSQIIIRYQDVTSADENTFYSYTEAAEREQIDVKNIKNGVRVEYSIGREQSKMLVPRLIEKNSFETKIVEKLKEELGEDAYEFRKFMAFYMSYIREGASQAQIEEYERKYPAFKKMDLYVIDDTVTQVDLARMEQNIKTYAPDYTFDNLDEDHLLTGYVGEDENPPLFRLALEYTLDKDGLSVRLPANGIRFNETLYRLTSIDILPWMGAAANPGFGYTFFPDGSGTLFDFEKIVETNASTTVTSKIYGQDFAYHTITGKQQEDVRYPVYGIVDTYQVVAETGEEYALTSVTAAGSTTPELKDVKRGFVAIIEEGEAMMELSTYHEVRAHNYNTVKPTVYPRPQDTYNIADAISVGQNSEWTVVSSRKYTGSYRIKYSLLTSEEVATEKGLAEYYDCSYVGMALAYRNYLINNGTLTKLTENDVEKDIPLYIETFGAMETREKILSVPVYVMTPLTSFEDIRTMYGDLEAEGITNVNFIMTGYANGGMFSSMPYNLKWEKAVGGKEGFEELLSYAKEKGFGLYPDFDFAYITGNTLTDGVSLKNHVVKTIDDRYANKREYSATKQTYLSFFELVISPAYFNRFYEKLTANYSKYEPLGISVSTLGYALNSDFDEDEPYNREDAKKFTAEAFAYLDEHYSSVITAEGNAFTWKYVDHITDIALDSSRYSQAGAAVPFLGIVLHGYVQLAGTPINMEGNIDYAFLKTIENGAALKFILSYQNTNNLKESQSLSKYFSVRYDIWFDDVVELYTKLNEVLANVQTSAIVDHKFVEGTRIPDADELLNDAQALIDAAVRDEKDILSTAGDAERLALLNARMHIFSAAAAYEKTVDSISTLYGDFFKIAMADAEGNVKDITRAELFESLYNEYVAMQPKLDALKAELAELEKDAETNAEAIVAKTEEITAMEKSIPEALLKANNAIDDTYKAAEKIVNNLEAFATSTKEARAAYELLAADGKMNPALLADLKTKVEAIEAAYEPIKNYGTEVLAYTNGDYYTAVKAKIDTAKTYDEFINAKTSKVEETDETVDARYVSDEDRIVYVEYENGVAFLLNFNNYAVRTEFNGNVYTIGAYGYNVIGFAN